MKIGNDGRPVCIGLGPTKPCGLVLHPGYTICTNCHRPYSGEEVRWAQEEMIKIIANANERKTQQ